MLSLTENARTVIQSIVSGPEDESAGLRIVGPQNGQDGLTVSTAAAPVEGDQVVDEEGARVFVEPGAAVLLDDKILDARLDAQGSVEFLVAAR